MNTVKQAVAADAELPQALETSGVGLACQLPADSGSDGQIWIPEGATLRIRISDPAHRARLLAAILDMAPDRDLRLVLLGAEVNALSRQERIALRARLAFLSATGGLLSNLNAWENIVLPLGCHHPERLKGIAVEVHSLVTELGAAPETLLCKLPEKMTVLERKITGFVRILLEAPDLVLVENFASGLDSDERMRIPYFAATYQARYPGGTFVQMEDVLDS